MFVCTNYMTSVLAMWPQVGDYFNAYPSDVLTIFDKVLHRTATELLENVSPENHGGQKAKEQRMRHTLHSRITGERSTWQ